MLALRRRWSVLAVALALAACSNGTLEGDGTDGGGAGPGRDGASSLPDGASGGDDDASTAPPPVPVGTVAELLVPFDANRQDLVGPDDHAAMYGKSPEIVPVPDGASVDLLVQDHGAGETPRAMILRLTPDGDDLAITRALEAPILDRVMGLARDEAGAYYVASGIDETRHTPITREYPAPGTFREGVVRVVKLDAAGEVAFDVDLDTARAAARGDAEPLINPMVAASARLAYGGGALALVHGNNTVPDSGGVRHQKAVTTLLRADTGEVTRTATIWCSHSFDQRLTHDGTGFVELHLGDAYPRFLAFARTTPERVSDVYPLFHIKGELGQNNTHTRLGGFAPIEGGGEMGFLALFASEHTTGTSAIEGASRIAGARDLAIVRVRRDFDAERPAAGAFLDGSLPDRLAVTSSGTARENVLRWLTDYQASDGGAVHAERPKLVALGGDRYVVLWERWAREARGFGFTGTWGTVIDARGETIVAARELTRDHLPRGDDAFRLGGDAAFVIGDREARALRVHRVSAALEHRVTVVE